MKINSRYTYTYDGYVMGETFYPPETINFVVDNIVGKIIWITTDEGKRFPLTLDSLVARKAIPLSEESSKKGLQ